MIEAGLGGRYDATNVIPSKRPGADQRRARAHALAGADGRRHRAREARRGAARARRSCSAPGMRPRRARGRARGRRRARRDDRPGRRRPRRRGRRAGRVSAAQLRARAGGRAGVPRRELDAAAVAAAAAEVRVPGRLQQVVDAEPLTLLDGAHNPDGIAALAESLPEIVAGRASRVVAVRLDPRRQGRRRRCCARCCRCCDALVLTSQPQSARAAARRRCSRSLDQLAPEADHVGDRAASPHAALRRARELAGPRRRRARDRLDLSGRRPAARRGRRGPQRSRCCERRPRKPPELPEDDRPRGRSVVAVMILVFFGIGYVFGRIFL